MQKHKNTHNREESKNIYTIKVDVHGGKKEKILQSKDNIQINDRLLWKFQQIKEQQGDYSDLLLLIHVKVNRDFHQ